VDGERTKDNPTKTRLCVFSSLARFVDSEINFVVFKYVGCETSREGGRVYVSESSTKCLVVVDGVGC